MGISCQVRKRGRFVETSPLYIYSFTPLSPRFFYLPSSTQQPKKYIRTQKKYWGKFAPLHFPHQVTPVDNDMVQCGERKPFSVHQLGKAEQPSCQTPGMVQHQWLERKVNNAHSVVGPAASLKTSGVFDIASSKCPVQLMSIAVSILRGIFEK